ncbi:MAG: MlaD family protein [Chthoniobacteraceae bacterium]
MKKNLSDYIVALSVILSSVVLFGALTMALTGWRTAGQGRTWQVDFPDVTGIHVQSQVRYAGAPAGSVINLRALTEEERRTAASGAAVRVTLKLFDDVPELPADVTVSVSSDTLLSDKFVALSAGSPDAPKLLEGKILVGTPAGGLDKLAETIGPSFERLVKAAENTLFSFDVAVGKAGVAVDTFKDGIGDALPRITELADELKVTADAATKTIGHIDQLVADVHDPVRNDLEEVRKTLAEMQNTLKSANELINGTDRQIESRMAELSVIMQNLKVATTHAKIMTRTLAEKPHRLIFGGKPPPIPTEQEILRSRTPVPVR